MKTIHDIASRYGAHRVISPEGLLPQAAWQLDNSLPIKDNELLLDVDALNIDSASFRQLLEEAEGKSQALADRVLAIVKERGKMQNPVTGSGGVLMGSVAQIGQDFPDQSLQVGDRVVSLVSLSLTPLRLDRVTGVAPAIEQVQVQGQAILFASGLFAKLPEDISEGLAMAALDVAGAPAQTAKIVKPGDKVLILGAGGKSGKLCAYEAKKQAGPKGRVVGMDYDDGPKELLLGHALLDAYFSADARNSMQVLERALEANHGDEYDVSINVVNVDGTEMAAILPVRQGGLVYFFSMATSFTRAALGAEGVGKDIQMIVGNGYTEGHAEHALNTLRESKALRQIFEAQYLKEEGGAS